MTAPFKFRALLGAALLSSSTLALAQSYEFRVPVPDATFPTPATPVEAWTDFLTNNGIAVPSDWGDMFTINAVNVGDFPTTPYPSTQINAGGYKLDLRDTDTTDLGGMSAITTMLGGIYLRNVPLTSLSVVRNATTANYTIRLDNLAITDMSDFSNFTQLNSRLTVLNNALLTSLSGLSGITTANSHVYFGNNAITDANGLSGLTSVNQNLEFRNNANLTSLAGLSSLTTVNNDLYVTGNPVLMSLTGLENLSHVGNWLAIQDYPSGFDMRALEGITSGLGPNTIRIHTGYDGPKLDASAYICQAANDGFWVVSGTMATRTEICNT